MESKGSNGVVERAVQAIEGQVRVLKLALEARIGMDIDAESKIVTFMAEYASYLMNRLEVGKDGKTAYERTKGKAATVLGIEFGEKLVWRKKAGQKMNKINSKWDYGIFVGVRQKSGEFWVANESGIHKARSVRRIAVQDRWTQDSVKWVKYVPWNRYKDQQDADGDIPEEAAVTWSLEGRKLTRGGPRLWSRPGRCPRGRSRSARRTPSGTGTREGAQGVPAGSEDWGGSRTRRSAGTDSQG